MTLIGHHSYLITKVCWNLGTSQSNRFHGASNVFPHVTGEVIHDLQVKTCCSDCGAAQATFTQTPWACPKQSPLEIQLISCACPAVFWLLFQPWLSHIGSVSAVIKGNAQCRSHSTDQVTLGLLWLASTVQHQHPWYSAGDGPGSEYHGWKPLGMLVLSGVSQDSGMTTGQQFLDVFTKNSYLKSTSPVMACIMVRDLKAIFQVKKAIYFDFYSGNLFQFIDRNCSHNSKEIAKREKTKHGFFYAHKMERNWSYCFLRCDPKEWEKWVDYFQVFYGT